MDILTYSMGIGGKLLELVIDIYAHNLADREITLAGNGTNCSEASNVADELCDILGIDIIKARSVIEERARKLNSSLEQVDIDAFWS